MSTARSPFPPSKVLVIGAGPSGLASYRNLAVHGKFDEVILYERRDDVGGVWYLDNPAPPQAVSLSQADTPLSPPHWPSPAYPGLIGNVLPEYLSFSRFPFPSTKDPNQPFPTLAETHRYLREFAEPFIKEGKIKLNVEVTRVEEAKGGGWTVEITDWNKPGGGKRTERWDAVVLAVGWYDNPRWPETPGLDALRANGVAQHAKYYRGPQGFEGKRVLIVGNANSGNDIAAHIAPIAQTPVYQSIRRPRFPGFPALPDDRIRMVPPVSRYELSSSPSNHQTITAHFHDGTTIPDIDFVWISTGYIPRPDFVHVLRPPSLPSSSVPNSNKEGYMRLVDQNPQPEAGPRVPSLHRHILYAYNPTLAFIGSPMSFTPFTVNDISSLWLTLVWNLDLPLLKPSPPSSRPDSPSSSVCYLNSPEVPSASKSHSLTEYLLQFESQRIQAIKAKRESMDDPSSFFTYAILTSSEESYAASLRQEVVSVKPDADEWFVMKWAPEQERRAHRERMYPMKYEALKYARDKARKERGEAVVDESQERGEVGLESGTPVEVGASD